MLKYFSPHNYIEYQEGNMNLILSAPHGGKMTPKSIPNRHAGTVVDGKIHYGHGLSGTKSNGNSEVRTKSDLNTKKLTNFIVKKIDQLTGGKRPYVIINNLHRSKLDPNRRVEPGAFGVRDAVEAWQAYHEYIEHAKSNISSQHRGRGLLVDLHGQAHSEDWIEIGYTLTADQMDNGYYTCSDTSIQGLALNLQEKHIDINIQELIRGPVSLGGMVMDHGLKVVPSPNYPSPAGGSYFIGGYITQRHGSSGTRDDNLDIDAIQIESPMILRTKTRLPYYSGVLSKVLLNYMTTYYEFKI